MGFCRVANTSTAWTDDEFAALPRCSHSIGYTRVYIGKCHPMATKSGWVLEHRVVMSRKIGRTLLSGEIVHHRDGNKKNNSPENLELLDNQFSHGVAHRKPHSKATRLPGEPNRMINCACGCGELIREYDSGNERHRFVYGHHQRVQSKPVRTAIFSELSKGEKNRSQLAAAAGTTVNSIASTLAKLRKAGTVVNIKRGLWGLSSG